MSAPQHLQQPLIADVRQLIDAARQRVAQAVNPELTQLYWQVGRRINTELLQGQRAAYGKQVMAELSRQLTADFGKGWSESQLHYCVRIAEVLPDAEILHTLCAQLSWSHLRLIIQIEDALKRDFYLEICRVEHWSVRQLQERINSLLFERTAISNKPSRCCHRVRPYRPSCTMPSNWHGRNWSAMYENPNRPQPKPCLCSKLHCRDQQAHRQDKVFAVKPVMANKY